jgi:hypothetical protein
MSDETIMNVATARAAVALVATALLAASLSCASSAAPDPPAPPPCDQLCLDQIALRALRESMKLVFNLTLQGQPVGAHDVTVPCPLGGQARVFGVATSNATQGYTEVKLTYVLDGCTLLQRDKEPEQNYRMVVSGTVVQEGVLAVQPTATTALAMKSAEISLVGTVYDPPVAYEEKACAVLLSQSGSRISGVLCGRDTTTDL